MAGHSRAALGIEKVICIPSPADRPLILLTTEELFLRSRVVVTNVSFA